MVNAHDNLHTQMVNADRSTVEMLRAAGLVSRRVGDEVIFCKGRVSEFCLRYQLPASAYTPLLCLLRTGLCYATISREQGEITASFSFKFNL
jgi:hypothetical protein